MKECTHVDGLVVEGNSHRLFGTLHVVWHPQLLVLLSCSGSVVQAEGAGLPVSPL